MSAPPLTDRAALLAARARRIARLRRRVVAATLATFVLAWGAIAWQGSLGTKADTATAQVREPSATATAAGTPDAAPSAPSDLTTGQS